MIKLLRSSAGSGKTYNLAKTYIRLLLESDDRYAYRHILAVTFTNKATSEMKNRILKELDRLAQNPDKSPYIKEFGPAFGGVEKVRRKASALLKDILNDYSAFSVSTIDRFFQQALRAFARELGQFSSYQVELDKEALVRESADRILDSIGTGDIPSEVRNWLRECLMDQLGQEGKMSLDRAMDAVVKNLKSDELREVMEQHSRCAEDVFSRDYLKAVRSECASIVKSFKARLGDAARAVLEGMKAAGLEAGDFHRNFNVGQLYGVIEKGSLPSEAFLKNIDDTTKWFVKAKQNLVPRAQANMAAPLAALHELCTGKDFLMYNTAGLLASQVFTLGLALELEKEYKALLDEKNVISLDDSNTALRDIIAGSDAPFIYEKLGVRYQNFLLDEFQDTSTIQWENFRPLLLESDANGGSNLLVGDVKQSIYRWRGGDWTLLDSGVKAQFPRADDASSLTDNWRSQPAIVDFNSRFFEFAARALDGKIGSGSLVQGIYADAAQTARTKDPAPGYVKCSFCESKEGELQELLQSVQAAREAGASYGQIAVLVRKNLQGSDVASFLVEAGIPVISDDSMRVKSSVTVRRLVSLLSCMDNEADTINRFMADELEITLPSSYDSLYSLAEELLRSLRQVNEDLYDGEVLYIQSFMDVLLTWSSSNGNSLSSFLRYWDEEDPKIASPDGTDAVRIMTIHKSKGLEFPYVIFPYAGEEELFDSRFTSRWCVPEREDGASELVSKGIFNVKMSSKTSDTVFASQYKQEERLQLVDNINTFYVAMTRAGKVLHTIAVKPSKADGDFKCFADILYAFTQEHGSAFGRMYCFEAPDDPIRPTAVGVWGSVSPSIDSPDSRQTVMPDLFGHLLPLTFRSSSLRGRMRSTGTGAEVFSAPIDSPDSRQTVMPDLIGHLPRLKGIIMHKILSDVNVAEDLPSAVDRAVASGLVEPAMATAYLSMLQTRLEEVKAYHWFEIADHAGNDKNVATSNKIRSTAIGVWGSVSPSIDSPDSRQTVLNEVGIIGADGSLHRPDRVIVGPDNSVTVIDYKFGEDHASYAAQVRRYCSLFRDMGYNNVSGYLWFVSDQKVVPVV